MEIKLLTVYLVFLEAAFLSTYITNVTAIQQSLELYREENCKGDSVTILEKMPDLNQLNWTQIASVKAAGRWMFYSHPYYNVDAQKDIRNYRIFSNFIKCSYFGKVVSSVRYVGWKHDMAQKSITLYERPDFQGQEEVLIGNRTNLDGVFNRGTVRSLIATGEIAWQAFESPNYRGPAICILPNQTQSLLTELRKINYKIKSVRLNCA